MNPQEATDAQIARALRDWLEQGVSALPDGMELPAPVRDRIITQLPTTPRRRRWWTDRWSTRGRGVMRSDGVPGDRDGRRSRRMFGFATLLAAGAIGGAALLAGINQQTTEPGPRTIVVAQDGSGVVATITEGVALAGDGDTVLIRPGVYQESVLVEEDIRLAGDGDREAVIVEGTAGSGSITSLTGPYSFVLVDSEAVLSDLTIRGMAGQVIVSGGRPTLQRLSFQGTGVPYGKNDPCADPRGCGNSLLITGGSAASVTDSLFVGGADLAVDGDSNPVFEDNELLDGPHFYLADPGDEAIVRNNTINGTLDRAIGVFAPTAMLIEGNRITDAGGDGITIGSVNGLVGVDPLVRGNTITDSGAAISVRRAAAPTIEGNILEDNISGVVLNRSDALVGGNQIRRHEGAGIMATFGGAPVIQGNVLEDNAQAMSLNGVEGAVISGNTLCGNGVDYRLYGDVAPLPSGNTTCGPASGAPSATP